MRNCLDSLSAFNYLESFGGDWPHLPIHRHISGLADVIQKSLSFPVDEKLGSFVPSHL